MEQWKQDKAFLNMDPQKQALIQSLAENLGDKKLTEALPLLTDWKNRMKRENVNFTAEENELLIQLFSSQLTPAQRQQYEYLKRFMK